MLWIHWSILLSQKQSKSGLRGCHCSYVNVWSACMQKPWSSGKPNKPHCLSPWAEQKPVHSCPSRRHYWRMCLYEVFRLWCELCSTFSKPYWKRLKFIPCFPLVPIVVNLNSAWLWYQKLNNKYIFPCCFNTFTVVTTCISPLLCIEHKWREFVCWRRCALIA